MMYSIVYHLLLILAHLGFCISVISKTEPITADQALPGRKETMQTSRTHAVNGNNMYPPFPDGTDVAVLGMGCFWGAEELYWKQEGVYSTQVGYSNGYTENPIYKEVCSGNTGHAEVVRVVFYKNVISYEQILKLFWENHDVTQGMRQGVDVGTQYRSAIYYINDDQARIARATRDEHQQYLRDQGSDKQITTEIQQLRDFFYAEDYHQQYFHKNPTETCSAVGNSLSGDGSACVRRMKKTDDAAQSDEQEVKVEL